MSYGKDIFCCGVDPYHFTDTDEVVVTVTTGVGQSTAIGPKVAIRKSRPFKRDVVAVDMGGGKSSSNVTTNLSPTITCTHGGEPVIGTIDASIYSKNSNQDNTKYIITKKSRKHTMESNEIKVALENAIKEGKDIVGVISTAESILKIVSSGIMTIEEAIDAMNDVRKSLNVKKEDVDVAVKAKVKSMEKFAKENEPMVEKNDVDKNNVVDDGDEEEVCIVRRLTPTETSRLQGFPDDYTKIDGVETADAPQFKAHGNSWATPCANFISTRTEMEIRRLGHEGTIRYATCCSGIEAHSVAVSKLDWKSMFFSEIEPFPCRVLSAHYPQTPNLGDMTQIHFDESKGVITNSHKEGEVYSLPKEFREAPIQELPFKVGDLEVFSGGTPCFTAGNLVLTETGYRPIEDIKVGDKVVTHQGRLRKVLATGKKMADNIVSVSCISRNEDIVCTADHKFWSAVNPHKDYSRKSDTYLKVLFDGCEFREIGKVGVGGYVAQLAKYDEIDIPKIPKVYNASTDDVIELAGWYVGDGYIRKFTGKSKECVVLTLSKEKKDKFVKRFSDKVNFSVGNPDTNGGIYRIPIYCTELCKWLVDNFGHLADGKNIPAWLICANDNIKKAFIAGYMATDGYSYGSVKFGASTVSRGLAYGLADLIGKACVCKAKVAGKKVMYDGRVVNQRDFYTVRRHSNPNHFHDYAKWSFVKVDGIESKPSAMVYNITVEEDHSYVVNGIAVKNCQDISIAGKRRGMAEDSGSRSSLAFHYQRIIDESRPMFTIWENVPGAFSSNGGADFIWFVNRCAESGYAMAWRVLDAQYTMTEEFPRAVPQRRRRIWLVGYRGNDWRIPARICFEMEKDLTANPPDRVPGIGFKTLNDGVDINAIRDAHNKKSSSSSDGDMFDLFGGLDTNDNKSLKVSKMISFGEMPSETDFSKVPMVSIYEFAKKVGEPSYVGDVMRKGKKRVCDIKRNFPEVIHDGEQCDYEKEIAEYEELCKKAEAGELEWEGAEKVNPKVLENIGNAGILANGRICTINCHEWTAGIQLSPKTYNAWEELQKNHDWLKANDLLPKAYDETVCGLSDVLQEDPDEKYNLSWRACFGILKRASTRGKELPVALSIALVSTIRDNAGIVKWYSIYGKDTKKKETDLTERESAKMCFEKYITSVANYDDVVPVQPKKRSEGESDSEGDADDDIQVDEDGNPILPDEEFGVKAEAPVKIDKEKVPEIPNGVINVSGGETAATLIASGDAAVGTTQDANIIAVKK